MTPSPITRRDFFRNAAIGLTAASTLGTARAQGANERIGVGFIGAGGRAGSHMDMLRHLRDTQNMPIEFVAVCDTYRPRMEARKKQFGIANSYDDHRELLADPGVDLVCIATPDHHHGYQAIDAIQAGKDVYCEKPVTHWRQFELTKKLAEVVAASDQVFQLGTQAMSDRVWHQMKKLVQEGLIGQPLSGETGFFRTGDWGERGMPIDDPDARPGPDLNWEAFLGDAPKHAFSVDRYFRWRLFEDYAGGPATDLYPHCLTQVVDILGVGFPSEVVALGGIHRYSYKLREVPDTFNLLAQYPEGITISTLGTQANDYQTTETRGAGQRCPVIRGWDGSLSIHQNREILFTPIRVQGAKPPQRIPIEGSEDNLEHWKNLVECCRTRSQATWSPMDLAFRTQTVLHMAMQAMREGKTMRFDPETQQMHS
jgi:predicted dehydrogenase